VGFSFRGRFIFHRIYIRSAGRVIQDDVFSVFVNIFRVAELLLFLNSFLAGRCTGGKMASRAEQQEMCAASIGG
jgi:hypothetical protein